MEKVDEAQALMRKEKKMALCEMCGSFFVENDATERTQSHVTGKQHIGYDMVHDFITEQKKRNLKRTENLSRDTETC